MLLVKKPCAASSVWFSCTGRPSLIAGMCFQTAVSIDGWVHAFHIAHCECEALLIHTLRSISLLCHIGLPQGTCTEPEKSYFRLTSAPDPSTVRPEPVLARALERLCRLLREGKENYFYAVDQFKVTASQHADFEDSKIHSIYSIETEVPAVTNGRTPG